MRTFFRKTACLAAAILLASCAGSGEPPVPTDFVATAEDFKCLADQPRVRNLRIANTLGYLDEAIALAEVLTPGEQYPIGTILQLVPGEAMVKRGPDFDPDNNNWEYFELNGQGRLAVANRQNGSNYRVNSTVYRISVPPAGACP